jgi:16S rRNA (guanine966-N2)-methyltransferase
MRVIAGRLRGRPLRTPSARSQDAELVRPSSQRTRTALFDALGARVDAARVLDLYAGAGTLGIEALSRGAEQAVFVERSRDALAALRGNLQDLELVGCSRVLSEDVESALERLRREGARFDLVLMDPPYRLGNAGRGSAGQESGSGSVRAREQGSPRVQDRRADFAQDSARETQRTGTGTGTGKGARKNGARKDRARKDRDGRDDRHGRSAPEAVAGWAAGGPLQGVLAALAEPGAWLVAERSRRDEVWALAGWELRDSRVHGETRLDCYERGEGGEDG